MKLKFTANKLPELHIIPPVENRHYQLEITKCIYSLEVSFEEEKYKSYKISELIKNEIVNMPILAEIITDNIIIREIAGYAYLLLIEKEKTYKYIMFPQEKTYEWASRLYAGNMRSIITWINCYFEFTESKPTKDKFVSVEWKEHTNWWKEEDLKIIKKALSLVNMSELHGLLEG